MDITVVIVTSQREEDFKKCLHSAWAQIKNIFVVINGEDAAAERLCKGHDIEYLILQNKVTPAQARNLSLSYVNTKWVHFLDDDAFVPPHFYFRASELIKGGDFDVLGGPNLTPRHSSEAQNLTGLALESFWGAGPCSKRYSSNDSKGFCGEESLILCNLLVKKELINSLKFPEYFLCGEENSFFAAAKKIKMKFYFDSELFVWHKRRAKVTQFYQQIYKYGVGRGQNILRSFDFNMFHLVPLACLVLAVCLIALSYYGLLAMLVSGYLLFNFWFSRKNLKLFFIFPFIHFFYALGMFRGALILGNVFEHKPLLFKPFKFFSKYNLK